MTAHTAVTTSPPWRVSTRYTSPSLACPSLEAPTLSLLAKVGWFWLPPARASCGRDGQGGFHSSPLPPWHHGFLCFHYLGVFSLLPCWSPSSASSCPSPSFSSRFHLRKNSLQLSRNLLLSALPTGSTVLGSVFLWEGRAGQESGAGVEQGEEAIYLGLGHRSWGYSTFQFFLECTLQSRGAKF